MKKLITLLLSTFILLALSAKVQASTFNYTFEGEINYIYDDAGIITSAGLSMGDTVAYTITLDFGADGYRLFNNSTYDTDSYIDTTSIDYFYADYASGDALSQLNDGFYNDPYNAAENNWGYDNLITGGGALHVNSDDDLLQIKHNSIAISDWTIGTTVNAGNWAVDPNNLYSQLFADVTLIEISPLNAVPVPAAVWLFASGLIGLIGVARRKKA